MQPQFVAWAVLQIKRRNKDLNLDLPEVHRLADQLVVLWQLFPRRQLDEHLAQLTPAGTAGSDITRVKLNISEAPESIASMIFY